MRNGKLGILLAVFMLFFSAVIVNARTTIEMNGRLYDKDDRHDRYFLLVGLPSQARIDTSIYDCKVSRVTGRPYCAGYDEQHDLWIMKGSHSKCCGTTQCC